MKPFQYYCRVKVSLKTFPHKLNPDDGTLYKPTGLGAFTMSMLSKVRKAKELFGIKVTN